MTRFDVVIPTFNAPAARLAAAVKSARACDGISRVIVIDDGSQPPTAACEGCELIRQGNAGPSAARNRGLEASVSAWVVFLDDDDELIPAGVAAMIALSERLNAVAGVAARFERRGGLVRPKNPPGEWAGRALPHWSDVLRPIAIFGASGLLVSRRVVAAGLRFDPGLRIGEDREFLARVGQEGAIAVSAEPALTVALRDEGNLTSASHLARRIRDHVVIAERFREPTCDGYLREATTWLVNAAAKSGVDAESWRAILGLMRARGWPVPLKARVRRMFRGTK
ncbi:MAG: glycosyltransferase family 2 protein [Phycisphaerales bacterium]|jgi:glycosyltransferase involved in cell wall biosynthesis|nr:glycosyltransferase family 2 protein [Phycisphaerales bacterium]